MVGTHERGLFTRRVGGESRLPTRASGDENDDELDPSQYRFGWDGLAPRDGASTGWGSLRVRGPLTKRMP